MGNDWLDKAKGKAQEAANAAMSAGANLKSAAEQLGQNIKSTVDTSKNEQPVSGEQDVAKLLANVEALLKNSLDKTNSAVELLNKLKAQLDKEQI